MGKQFHVGPLCPVCGYSLSGGLHAMFRCEDPGEAPQPEVKEAPSLHRQPPTLLPVDSQARKDTPIFSGFMNYFPLAMAEVARVSKAGNDKHNPGEPLHWSRGKSNDHADCIARHLLEHGTIDVEDGLRHSAKLVWRACALLQEELEKANGHV